MLIGILENGRMPDELKPDYISYVEMFKCLLGKNCDQLEFRAYRVLDDEFPDSVTDCDGWLITGSRFGVYDDLPWMRKEKDFILASQAANIPMIGICFGHQIIATALGGKVEKSQKGWGVGLHQYKLNKTLPWMASAPDQLTLNAMHQDQVVELPPGADVLASSEFCEYAGLVYGKNILTFQAHPEFSSQFEKELLELRKGEVIPLDRAEPALAALNDDPLAAQGDLVGSWMAGFFVEHERKTA